MNLTVHRCWRRSLKGGESCLFKTSFTTFETSSIFVSIFLHHHYLLRDSAICHVYNPSNLLSTFWDEWKRLISPISSRTCTSIKQSISNLIFTAVEYNTICFAKHPHFYCRNSWKYCILYFIFHKIRFDFVCYKIKIPIHFPLKLPFWIELCI